MWEVLRNFLLNASATEPTGFKIRHLYMACARYGMEKPTFPCTRTYLQRTMQQALKSCTARSSFYYSTSFTNRYITDTRIYKFVTDTYY